MDLNAKLIPLKSEVAGRVPTGTQVDVGEIAVNLTDRKIFSKRTDGTVVVLAGGSQIQDSEDAQLTDLADWDLLRWDASASLFVNSTPDQLWTQLDKNLEDLHNVNADAPNEGDGLIWDASLGEWKPARLPSIELIERQVPSYRWTLAPGASPVEGEYRVAADGLNLNQIDADGNNLVNWFGYYPDDSGNYWWSTDDLNWNQATYTSKNDNGSHLRIFSNDALPPNPTVIYVALGQPNTVEQLPLKEGDLIQWDGDAWVPISINDLVVDITQFSIGDLKDVDTTTSPPLNGYVLTWNDTQQKWIPGVAAQGKNNFYELNDVALVDVQDGQMVAWDFAASAWVNVDPPASGIGEAPDFELNTQPAPSGYYQLNTANPLANPAPSGTYTTPNTWQISFSTTDTDGVSQLAAIQALNPGMNANVTFFMRDEASDAWSTVQATNFYLDGTTQVLVSNASGIPTITGDDVYVSFGTPGADLDVPLADGDVLVYSNGKWRPKQEALLEVDLGRYELDDLGDVDVSTVAPAVGEALLWDGIKWLPGTVEGGGGGSGGGWMGNRSDDTVTTTTLAQAGGTDDTVVFLEMGQSGQFVSITVDQPAWVRLYASATDRTNDALRQLNTDPLPGSGVLLEVLTSQENETVPITPGAVYYNNDPLPASKIYARVSNYSTAEQPITVTVTCIAQTFFDVISGGTFGSGF